MLRADAHRGSLSLHLNGVLMNAEYQLTLVRVSGHGAGHD
jgi:hypothetical protein